MRKTLILISGLLCLAVCLTGCGKRPETPSAGPAPETQETSAPTPAPTAEPASAEPAPAGTASAAPFDRDRYDAAAEAVLDEYRTLRGKGLDDFDENAHPQLPWYSAVVAAGRWNSLYYGYWDFDENGVPELIVSAGEDDYSQPVGIYAFDGEKMLYLCPDQALGERASVTFVDGLFFIRASGGAAVGSVIVYRIAPDGYSTDLIEIMDYEYSDPETVTYTPELGNMTAEELLSHDYMKGFSVPVDFIKFSESSGGDTAEMPNPWSQAMTPEEAAQGAVLDRFVLPEVIGCSPYAPEDRRLSYTDGLAEAVYYNGTDALVIRKGTGSQNISGDYNVYPESGTLHFKGLEIQCFGQDGQIRLARWEFGGNSYSLTFNAGDMARPGLTEDQVTSLVNQIG